MNVDIGGALANGNTVISSANVGVCYIDKIRFARVNSICVGALARSYYFDVVEANIIASKQEEMEGFGVH